MPLLSRIFHWLLTVSVVLLWFLIGFSASLFAVKGLGGNPATRVAAGIFSGTICSGVAGLLVAPEQDRSFARVLFVGGVFVSVLYFWIRLYLNHGFIAGDQIRLTWAVIGGGVVYALDKRIISWPGWMRELAIGIHVVAFGVVAVLSIPILPMVLREDFEDFHEIVDKQESIVSPSGAHMAIVQGGHIEPYFVGPVFFQKILVGDQGNDRTKDILVFRTEWGAPQRIAWNDDSHLLITMTDVQSITDCIHHAHGVDVEVRLSDFLLRPDQYRKQLDDLDALATSRELRSFPPGKDPQRAKQALDLVHDDTERDWKGYLHFRESVRDDAKSGMHCILADASPSDNAN